MKILVAILFLSLPAMAQKTVNCSNGQCTTNFAPQLLLEKPMYTAIDIGVNSENVEVSVPANQTPRSVRLNINNGAYPGRNLMLNLSSTRGTDNAGSTVVIGDFFNNLQINLNGNNGVKGKDASEICATRVQAGQYGIDIRNFFNQRRSADPGLNPNRCDRIDLSYLQSYAFSCDSGFSEALGSYPIVEVQRLRSRSRCQSTLVRDICYKKTADVTCYYRYCSSPNKGACNGYQYGQMTTRTYEEDFMFIFNNTGSLISYCEQSSVKGQFTSALSSWESYQAPNVKIIQPGIDLTTLQLQPNSLWQLYYSQHNQTCAQAYSLLRTVAQILIAYDDTTTCANARNDALDPNRLLSWVYTGQAQEAGFGLETLTCTIDDCLAQSSLFDSERFIDEIFPESGTNGTQQGNGIALIYDALNVSSSASIGQAGAGGLADLSINPQSRYCVRIRDAVTEGESSEYARNPIVAFRRYAWRAIKVGAGGNSGTPPATSTNGVEVWKKIDSSVRHLLSKELL